MKIVTLSTPAEAASWCAAQRAAQHSVGFVPTMGALHAGHLSLVQRALDENDVACVSVFVNPLQFDEGRDLEMYPRDWEGDVAQLEALCCQMVFTGTLAQFFPGELDARGALGPERILAAGPGAQGLEGDCRKGHFGGVATIVDRLFELIQPRRAYFGQKDYQQSLVVREVARQHPGLQIVVCPIAREASGLARSSRNERLPRRERKRAACLSRALSRVSHLWRRGLRDGAQLEAELRAELEGPGVSIEYAALRELSNWTVEGAVGDLQEAVALVAARFGDVRLIDNHILSEPPPHPVTEFADLSPSEVH